MSKQIDWLESYRRAGHKLWRHLCNGGPLKLPPSDPRHGQYEATMARVKVGILRAIERKAL